MKWCSPTFFVALADTLLNDFDFVELLDRLVHTCVDVLNVAAGVLLLDQQRRLRLVASSSERAEELEAFQVQADEGPCLDCARSRTPVAVPDLETARGRWPRFCSAADIPGFRAVHALPSCLRARALGGLNLFHTSPTMLAAAEVRVAQALANVATIGILQQQHDHQTSALTEQLQGALDSRVAVEQAKGILAEGGHVSMDVALAHSAATPATATSDSPTWQAPSSTATSTHSRSPRPRGAAPAAQAATRLPSLATPVGLPLAEMTLPQAADCSGVQRSDETTGTTVTENGEAINSHARRTRVFTRYVAV